MTISRVSTPMLAAGTAQITTGLLGVVALLVIFDLEGFALLGGLAVVWLLSSVTATLGYLTGASWTIHHQRKPDRAPDERAQLGSDPAGVRFLSILITTIFISSIVVNQFTAGTALPDNAIPLLATAVALAILVAASGVYHAITRWSS